MKILMSISIVVVGIILLHVLFSVVKWWFSTWEAQLFPSISNDLVYEKPMEEVTGYLYIYQDMEEVNRAMKQKSFFIGSVIITRNDGKVYLIDNTAELNCYGALITCGTFVDIKERVNTNAAVGFDNSTGIR